MISVLLYSRDNPNMTKTLADQLDHLGFSTEQTQTLNLPRIILNPYRVIHIIADELPLTMSELFCISAAKTLGKSVVLSVLNTSKDQTLSGMSNWIQPDALTVSQTNHFKNYREKESTKMVLPQLFDFEAVKPKKKMSEPVEGFLFPLFKNLNEACEFKSNKPVYFDGRELVRHHSSSTLRKTWAQLLKERKIPSHYHLILSSEKIKSVLEEEPLALVLASPTMSHSIFSKWLELALTHQHLVVLNQFQATGFSSHWTSGHNCLVLSSYNWLIELNAQVENPVFTKPFALTDISKSTLDPLFNELSRLYTKIIYQKTTLLDSDSAKI